MEIVYTCNHEDCKLICKNISCRNCIIQCHRHKIELDRTFNVNEHSYTINADTEDSLRFIVRHSGIPLSCEDCKSDLTDHQTLHKIYHGRCKFCRQIMEPFDYYHVITTEDYDEALTQIAFRAKVTCATCLRMFEHPTTTRRHEQTIHEKSKSNQCNE